jgi:hypothetical protein
MSQLASLARFVGSTLFALALGSACGGKSFEADGDDDGGSSAGGTSSQSGTKATAGKAQGGVGTGGTTLATAGTTSTSGTGSGGAVTGRCSGPPEVGPCEAAQPAWYHDESTGICRPFTYGGCEGNANRYDSLAACQDACKSGPNYDACNAPSECVVAGTGCCGICDSPSLSAQDFVAYNRKYAPLLQCAVPLGLPLPDDTAGAPIACAPCPPVADGALEYFVPDCVQNQCRVLDLRDPQFTACTTDEDCTFRYGTSCCQTCNVADAIPLRTDAKLEARLCDGAAACAACPPVDLKSRPVPLCGASGRCELRYIAF